MKSREGLLWELNDDKKPLPSFHHEYIRIPKVFRTSVNHLKYQPYFGLILALIARSVLQLGLTNLDINKTKDYF